MMKREDKLVRPDLYLLITVLVLLAIGVLLVFDASYAKAGDFQSMNFDVQYLVKRQAIYAGVGLLCMTIAMFVSFDRLKWLTLPVLGLGSLLLFVVLVMGHVAHGARSWLTWGSFSVQPSEFVKLAIVLFLAGVLSRPKVFSRGQPRRWLVPAALCAALIGMIVLQHDLGTATLMTTVCFVMFFAAGAKKCYLALTGIVALAMVAGMMYAMPHCRARIRAWLDPWKYRYAEGYQTVHSLSGLGTGGLTGVGPCKGREKYYMPASSTDYIVSTLGEEAGIVGVLVLLSGFVFFSYRGLHIAHRSSSTYGALVATGMTALVSVQAIINVAVVTSAIPATGLPLPLISYGGSSLVASLMAVGVLLSTSRQVNVAQEKEPSESSPNRRRNRRPHISGDKHRTSASGYRSASRAAVRR